MFLRTQASQAQGKYISATHVLVGSGEVADGTLRPIVGFVTLVTSVIPLAECPPSLKRITNKPHLPTLLLAQMAVDVTHKGKRLGECLLKHALVTALQLKESSGCCAVIVDAINEDAKRFYLKYGFVPMPDKPMRLFLVINSIEKIFSN
ncbi:MAG: GNAT family N-acetyltransferase [Terriglobales bacterium]